MAHSTRSLFTYYKHLGDRTLERLDAQQLHWQPGEESNSIATIVKHLSGNMRSRFTDFLTTDGEKDFRDRDGEFRTDSSTPEVIKMRWESGWSHVFAALDAVEATGDETATVFIRAKGHSVREALERQLAHYAYHIGQIVFLGRLLLGNEWQSLSIARGDSKAYNAKSFAEGPRSEHFTREFIDSKEDV